MAEQFAAFKDAYPIMEAAPIEAADKGATAMADVFGQITEKAVQIGETLKKEQKDTMLLSSSNQLSETMNDARVQLKLNPNMANHILQKATENANSISQGIPDSHKLQWQKIYDSQLGKVKLDAASAQHQVIMRQIKLRISHELPQSLDDLNNNLDPKAAQAQQDLLVNNVNTWAQLGYMTPEQHENAIKQVKGIIDRHAQMHDLALQGGASAAQYQAISKISPTNNGITQPGTPLDENTNFHYDHYDQENTKQSALADADKGIYPDQSTLLSLSDNDFQEVTHRYLGALSAEGAVNANTHFGSIQAEHQRLKDASSLSITDKGKLNYLDTLTKKIDNGQALDVLTNTAKGADIDHDYITQKAAIEDLPYSNQVKVQLANQNLNSRMTKYLSLARASGYPVEKTNLMPSDVQLNMQNGFKKDADVSSTVDSLYSVNKNLQYWAAKSVKAPEQRAAIWLSALERNASTNGQPTDFTYGVMRAAQDNKDYSALKLGERNEKDTDISQSITSALAPELAFMGLQPEGQSASGGSWSNGVVKLGVNYVKDRALNNNDINLNHANETVSEYVLNVKKGFNLVHGLGYNFNANELPIDDKSAQALNYYLKDDFYKKLEAKHGAVIRGAVTDLFTLTATNTKDGSIVLIDPQNQVVESIPYTSKVQALANQRLKENKKEIESLISSQTQSTPFSQLGIH